MNRLKFSRCYLVGPMDFCREDGKVWREDISEFLSKLGVIVLNPYKKPLHECHGDTMLEDDLHAAERAKAFERRDYDAVTANMKPVRAVDLRMVDHSDFLIVYLNFSVTMTGTMEELFTGNREKKPIIILSSVPKHKIPPWYFATLPHRLFFDNLDDIKAYIDSVNSAPEVDTLNGRWVFFDIEDQIKEIIQNE